MSSINPSNCFSIIFDRSLFLGFFFRNILDHFPLIRFNLFLIWCWNFLSSSICVKSSGRSSNLLRLFAIQVKTKQAVSFTLRYRVFCGPLLLSCLKKLNFDSSSSALFCQRMLTLYFFSNFGLLNHTMPFLE